MIGPPCEIVFWKIGPSFRGHLVKRLIENGMKQRDVAKTLELTDAAVSQYLSGKRGVMDFDNKMHHIVSKTASHITTNPQKSRPLYIGGVCEVCKYLKKTGKMCELHGFEKGECKCGM